jgi:hypothetical protein
VQQLVVLDQTGQRVLLAYVGLHPTLHTLFCNRDRHVGLAIDLAMMFCWCTH